ncbi:hypothetical protein D9757_011622 [Collybiopsis confluens]|uniref:Uncharacterized protein n=1 Tax=Collybiopsis confluens TaxID=2823264 RepID=A0A8H5LWQ9_9AGAR|nr:hypothetical protein D9757_011622 [Collybiopsis confluens]
MLLTDLPPELHQIITNNIPDQASLCSLLRTCHSLYFEAERSLYHTFDDIRSLKRQVLFLQRVTECPRLARLVRVYRIQPAPPGSEALMTFCGTPSSSSLYIPSSTARLFWTLLPIAFHLFVNLRVLALHSSTPYDGGAAILPTSRFLRGCSFQLETLEWGWYTPNEPRDLLPFLATQQHLRNISLRGWDAETFPGPAEYSSRIHQIHQHHPAHSDSAVHTKDNTQQITRRSTSHSQDFAEESDSESYHCGLSVLTGPQGAVKAFLPGHKITHLRWLADLDDPWCEGPGFDPDSPELIGSFKQIKFLKFGAWFARPSLGILAPYLGQLIFLELTDVDKVRKIFPFFCFLI